jgi:hypothetical protein
MVRTRVPLRNSKNTCAIAKLWHRAIVRRRVPLRNGKNTCAIAQYLFFAIVIQNWENSYTV